MTKIARTNATKNMYKLFILFCLTYLTCPAVGVSPLYSYEFKSQLKNYFFFIDKVLLVVY